MGIFEVCLTASNRWNGHHHYSFHGTASSLEIAIRQAKRAAKRQELFNIKLVSATRIGDRDFGR